MENGRSAQDVIDFFKRNKDHFASSEAAHSNSFYTVPFMRTILDKEYQLATRMESVRFWLYEKVCPDYIIGTISFNGITGYPFSRCEVGYRMDKDYVGRGYAYEALSFASEVLAEDLSIHRMEAHIQPENLRSIHLIERLGFEYEGLCKRYAHIQGTWKDHYLYARVFPDSHAAKNIRKGSESV
ncbi:MAG: GNAT family N-acetyltransferase [Eubacterium sp.]|nr:GNAT family N-acetyltransferase [Eubacterium sp.]